MNTKKHKHKNRPKPNTGSTGNVEVKEEKGDVIDKIEQRLDIDKPEEKKPEESVKVEKSETTIETPLQDKVIGVKETAELPESKNESEPAKPKRNKNKKKKQDLEKPTEEKIAPEKPDAIAEVVLSAEQAITSVEEKEAEAEIEVDAAIIPNTRKKKNKKKNQEKPVEATPIKDLKPQDVCLLDKIEDVDAEVTELFSSTPEPLQEGKGKKKNKKKKRNDSERSDKSEDIKCKAAFEKLLIEEPKLQEAEIKETKVKEDENQGKSLEEVTMVIKDDIIKETTTIEEFPEIVKEQSKSKKKNKKDKKHAETQQQTENMPELITIPTEAQETLVLIDTVIEESPKPKAKIAKPVEKKSKDNKEVTKPVENISKSTENIQMIPETIATPCTIVKEDIKEVESKSIIDPEQTETKTLEDNKFGTQAENLKIPETSTMGKKRKKSPKLTKTDLKVTENISASKPNIIQTKPEDGCLKFKELGLVNEPEMITLTQTEEIKTETNENITNVEEVKAPSDDTVLTVLPETEEKTAEGKAGKKKKKTPKIPTQSEIHVEKVVSSIDSKDAIYSDQTQAVPEKTMELKDSVKKRVKETEIKSKPVSLEDIEVRSVRTDESEGSTCDVIPDVHFERSSSQQRFDDNNNTTVIQELTCLEDVKFTDTLSIPIIEGSGETPITTPEDTRSIQLTKSVEKDQGKDETIKSKMMEVNKDMEELRMSIERSIAEFTAMEKTEQQSEKLFEEKQKQEPQDTTVLKQEPVEIEKKINTSTEEIIITKQIPSETQESKCLDTPPCPVRKDKKGKGKKGKDKLDSPAPTTASTQSSSTTIESSDKTKEGKKEKQEKEEKKSQSTESKGKQQSDSIELDHASEPKDISSDVTNLTRSDNLFSDSLEQLDYDRIDNFEDALTSSNDDVNKTFELIAQDAETENQNTQKELSANKPKISVTDAEDDAKTKRNEKVNPVSQPKNLLGPNDIPVPSNKTDYKKEKNKPPNERQAKVKIKDATDIEKISKESQTNSRIKTIEKSVKDTFSHVVKDNDEYVYKYSFRKVFLQSACHVCKKDLGQVRVPCGYCNLVFYCGTKHKDENYSQHQALCFAVSTIVHLKDQKHIYADAKGITGQDYRILRMQMILSCEKVLKRRLVPWEQESMLYPRICADVACREWRQGRLKDCEGCGQISYCATDPSHLPKSHQRWCKSYSLYAKLVTYQQTKGRLEPRLPTKVLQKYEMPAKMNEVLAAMYEEKIDMNDIQYAALTQLATAPLTAAYYHQQYRAKNKPIHFPNGTYKKPFVIHVVGAELQFEADALNKWEVFFLHLRPDVQDMTVVLISPALNPGNLPLDLLGKVRMCTNCKENNRRVTFSFQDMPYYEYRISELFINPDLICAFNPSIQRSSSYNMKDTWSSTITSILKLKSPFIITAYTLPELRKDIAKIKELSEVDFSIIAEPILNSFASVRPDRNFITDDELPLLFKNYCVSVICGC